MLRTERPIRASGIAAAVAVLAAILSAGCPDPAPKADYAFDGAISAEVLDNYLSRAVSHQTLFTDWDEVLLSDDIRMLLSIGAKFIGRASILWESPEDIDAFFLTARDLASRLHRADGEMILQAGLFEVVDEGVESIAVPPWVFEEFGLTFEDRTYSYDGMIYVDGSYLNDFGDGSSVPDISRPETRMWFYHRGRLYIDCGYEALHLGVVDSISMNDPDHAFLAELLGKLRSYAKDNARRRLVLCDAHHKTGWAIEGRTLFDFLSYPLRVQERSDRPFEGELRIDAEDSIYGGTSGGLVPSLWYADSLPYLAELDNWGSSGSGGEDIGDIWIWGWDEIDWFARLGATERDSWLAYARDWIDRNTSGGHLQMPTRRILADPIGERYYWYSANDVSPSCPGGFGQEGAIKAILAAGGSGR